MKRFLLSMLIGAMALVADAQSTFMGQCVNLMKSSGDSISLDLQDCASISPQVKDGKIVWNIIWTELCFTGRSVVLDQEVFI